MTGRTHFCRRCTRINADVSFLKISSAFICVHLRLILLLLLLLPGCQKSAPRVIVCLGDSLTACGGPDGRYSDYLAKWFPNDIIYNEGVGGDTLAGGRARFQKDVLDHNPDIVIIELGANDFWQQKRKIEDLQADLEDMVQRAKKAGAKVLIASCFGQRNYEAEPKLEFEKSRANFAQSIADMEQKLVNRYRCAYVPNMQADIKPNGRPPYWDDQNHPNQTGNEFVARRIFNELKTLIPQ